MGAGALAVFYLGEAAVYTIIWFSLISFLFKSPVRRRRTWVTGFFLVTITLAIINAFIKSIIPENISDDNLVTVYGVEATAIPILVSFFYWILINMFFSKSA